MKKIGLLGGTFDPIHIGHLILAESALEQLSLEKVLFIPAGNPPHKSARPNGAANADRLEMVRLALAGNSRFDVDTIEMDSDDKSYSYLLLKHLKERDPSADYYFIIGEDSLIDFDTWRNPEEIVKLAHIVAADRPGYEGRSMKKTAEEKRSMFGGDFIIIECPDIQISSTDIRKRVASGLGARYYVPDAVNEYIMNKGLYK